MSARPPIPSIRIVHEAGQTLVDQVAKPCELCAEYRCGDRENVVNFGINFHLCDRAVVCGFGVGVTCPCGCAYRDPREIERDKLLYGNAFIGPLGERLDPTGITALLQASQEHTR